MKQSQGIPNNIVNSSAREMFWKYLDNDVKTDCFTHVL